MTASPERVAVMGPKRRSIEERFWAKVKKSDGCWEWTGDKNKGRYGSIYCSEEKRNLRAHRMSYEMHKGPITDGLWVLHRCDNPPCVNPDHLFLGTARDNIMDAIKKGRHIPFNGLRFKYVRCAKGHDFTPENTYRSKSDPNRRRCLICQTAYRRERTLRTPRTRRNRRPVVRIYRSRSTSSETGKGEA